MPRGGTVMGSPAPYGSRIPNAGRLLVPGALVLLTLASGPAMSPPPPDAETIEPAAARPRSEPDGDEARAPMVLGEELMDRFRVRVRPRPNRPTAPVIADPGEAAAGPPMVLTD